MSNPPKIIAHRGDSQNAPENTLAAVISAWDKGADAVEVDVHLSADNRIVVIHDDTTQRTSNRSCIVRETHSVELRMLDAGTHKSPHYADEKIPFLEEVIDTVPDGKKLFIEIKCGASILPFLEECIEKSGKASQISLIGFDFDTISQCKKRFPDNEVYLLFGSRKKIFRNYFAHDITPLIEKSCQAELDGIDIEYQGLTPECIDSCRSAGLKIITWTVNNPEDIKHILSTDIDAITTDCPSVAKVILDNNANIF